MKKIRTRHLSWDELDRTLGPRKPAEWRFHLKRLALPELNVDEAGGGASFPDYLPVETLLAEVLESGGGDLRECLECGEVRDIDEAEGIFADFESLEGWICESCARRLSAYDFFHRHVMRAAP